MKIVPSWSSVQERGEITNAIIRKIDMSFVKRGVHNQDGPYNLFKEMDRTKIVVLCTKHNRDVAYIII